VFSNAFHTYQAEIFPTGIRSSAISVAYSLSRATSAVLPFVALNANDFTQCDLACPGCLGRG
jgi:MFS transporter, putative metabolite:H+ symporter